VKVIVLGLDCAPPDLLFNDWLDDLPNIRQLVRNGLWGRIRSSDPPITVPAWATFFTGKNPGHLGLFGFRNRKNFSYEEMSIANLRAIRVDTLWDILSRHGRKVGVLGVPPSYPPKPVNGFMVGCFLTPDTNSRYTYPDSLREEITRVVGEYHVDVDEFRTENKTALLSRIREMTEQRWRLLRHLMKTQEWDLLMMVEMGTDRIHHGFWKYFDPQHKKFEPNSPFARCIPEYYKFLDGEIGKVLELLDDDTAVVVVSDHGAKRMDGAVNINDWLISEGYLKLKETPSKVTRLEEVKIDWSRTRAWAWGGYYARIFLNIEGREKEGIVAQHDYERFQNELTEKLSALKDEHGRVMNTRVLRPQEIYSGPFTSQAPDLLVYFDDLLWRASQDIGHEGIHSFDTEVGPDDAVHDYEGLFVLFDPSGQTPRGERFGMNMLDGAPTLLHLLGEEVPADMEGKIIG